MAVNCAAFTETLLESELGREDTLHLQSQAACCVSEVTLKDEQGKIFLQNPLTDDGMEYIQANQRDEWDEFYEVTRDEVRRYEAI